MTLLDQSGFFLYFFYFLRYRLAGSATLVLYFCLAAAGLAGSADFPI